MSDTTIAQPAPAVTGTLGVIRAMAKDIKLAHSVFALPFAVLGALLAWDRTEPASTTWLKLVLVVVCMVCARTWAMVVNRLADRHIDSENPRTVRRAIASGRVLFADGIKIALVSALVFVAACSGFWFVDGNIWPVVLSIPVLGWIALYSFTKRFTALCHVFLGGALAASPIAAGIAMQPEAVADMPALWLLAGMVVFWVAGFDVIYALQDLSFDREKKLHSIPAALGADGALWVSRVFHVIAIVMLVLAWQQDTRFGIVFGLGVVAAVMLLAAEHLVLMKQGEKGLAMAFFTLNGIVSCVLGIAGAIDIFA
ncbi:MAG: UbiA family prenyltransferase [Phycisphaeraceae bacterium]|nr:putative 4-hydroxybenzoate polyprenyltransferase [Phycisphaerales bacterium]MCB9859315.1 UbiA family prenyltransferase [Phycisphaeraceae bacterium]